MTSKANADDSKKKDDTQQRRPGVYVLKSIEKLTRNGRKINIEWNSKGQPIGDHVSLFQHFVGFHTRARVPIGIPRWKVVPQELKDLICQAVMDKFDVDEMHMKLILRSASTKWSDFKSKLTTDYMYVDKDKTQIRTQPPMEYPFIDQDNWGEFIKQRCSKNFQEISERNSENAKQIKHPFKSARKSYARIEEEMLKERGLDPKTTSLQRYELWLAGRRGYNDEYDVDVVDIVRKIGSLQEQVTQGQISIEGREDILALALGKKEHPGRVRGVGAGVGLKKFFPTLSGQKYSNAASEMRINELQEKLEALEKENASRDQLLQQLQSQVEIFRKSWIQNHEEEPPVLVSVSSSNNVSSKRKHILSQEPLDTWEDCDLFWPDLNSKVARARVMVPMPGKVIMHHCQPLQSDKLKILVVDALKPDVVVPFPNEEVTFVLEAKNTPVVWPKKLVVTQFRNQNSGYAEDQTPKKKQVSGNAHQHQQSATALEKYNAIYPSLLASFLITIKVEKDVLSHAQEVHIGKEQIRACLQKNALDNAHVALYMKYLYESHPSDMFAFFCPTYIADDNVDSEEQKEKYMVDSMIEKERENRIWFAPYNKEFHWMLAVINPWSNIVYWLDPLKKVIPDSFKAMVDTAITVFAAHKDKSRRKKTRWLSINCPKQESTSLECGFYVCRYMREIMDEKSDVIPINYFQKIPKTYNTQLIDEIREEWLQYLETQSAK